MAMSANAQSEQRDFKERTAYMVADAHLDTQWNWDVQTTIRSHIWNTMVQNFMLFRQYPDYIFNFEGGVKYAWMKEYYPTQYEEVKRWIGLGRWHIAGSAWDANETIICSPESWIRNVLLGQTFYRQEFGKEGTDVFLPDCFGFPYTLPTLARHCGLIGFSSQKLGWRTVPFFEDGRRYPFSLGLWQGVDGSRIMMAHGYGYGQRYNDEDLSKNKGLLRKTDESPVGIAYRYYGTGDIGGSPTINSVRSVEKGLKGDGPVRIISATSDQLYKDLTQAKVSLPVYDGELTMDLHGNGCYTSQAAMKFYNRQNEHLGDAAERAAVMADWAGVYRYPIEQMTETWKRVIWHQFHDDVTGTSIPRAYEFSWNDELLSLKQFADVLTTSVGGIVRLMDTNVSGTPVVVYNNEAFAVKGVVKVNLNDNRNYTVTDGNGRKVNAQMGDGQLLFEASVPATGFAVYSIKAGGKIKISKLKTPLELCSLATAGTQENSNLENSIYSLRVDANGDIESLFDKRAQKELVAEGKRIRLVVFDDCKSEAWPAWEIHKRTLDKDPLPIHDGVVVALTEDGPLRKTLCVTKKYGTTDIRQYIHLYEGAQADRIDFETTVDWKAENALLKAEFPLSVSNEKASYDIGLGKVERGNNTPQAHEVYSHEWTDLTDRSGSYGVTILNDSRYGWDKPNDNTLRLSLLYAPKPNRGYVYQAHQDKGHHVFTYSIVGHQGSLNMVDATQKATMLNSPLRAFETPKYKGELGREFSFVNSDNPNVLIRTLKRAEASDEYVVRVYELSGKSEQQANLTFASAITEAVEADGTEKTIGNATFAGNQLKVAIRPFSVKTYKVKLAQQPLPPPSPKGEGATESPSFWRGGGGGFLSPLTSHLLPLKYNKKCFTFNEFRTEADFEGGYSYAAELRPDQLTVDGITFQFGEIDGLNGLACKGDTLRLGSADHYRILYMLAASNKGDRQATFRIGNTEQAVEVPFYTGFIGQWGHDGQTEGYLKQTQVAYVGTHRHSTGQDEPYEYTYMFKLRLDIPKGISEVILPSDEHVVLFAATLVDELPETVPLSKLFQTSNIDDNSYAKSADSNAPEAPSLLKEAKILSYSGFVNEEERPELLVDGNPDTKWCDTNKVPNYVTFDLGSVLPVSRWHLLNAGCESAVYITRTCILQGRINEQEEWQTLDMIDGNRQNEIDRKFPPVSVRYVRLFVVTPTQSINDATRIYEFDLW